MGQASVHDTHDTTARETGDRGGFSCFFPSLNTQLKRKGYSVSSFYPPTQHHDTGINPSQVLCASSHTHIDCCLSSPPFSFFAHRTAMKSLSSELPRLPQLATPPTTPKRLYLTPQASIYKPSGLVLIPNRFAWFLNVCEGCTSPPVAAGTKPRTEEAEHDTISCANPLSSQNSHSPY